MHPRERALLDIRPALTKEITRFGGLNPFGGPVWRVVLAQNVFDQRFGQMRHMPQVNVDYVTPDMEIEPEGFSAGEMWVPRYEGKGYCLERWFPASTWGALADWEHETSQDGVTQMMGEFPRHGDYQMANDEFYAELPPTDFWKEEILKWIRARAEMEMDEVSRLRLALYRHRVAEERRREEFLEQVNQIHRAVSDPTLATIGRTAQSVRDGLMAGMGSNSHLSAG
jgi:hypothetical protein